MKRLLVALLLFISCPLVASHIVGGEIEMLHLTGFSYRVNLIYYFDVINGDPRAEENSMYVYFYRKADNALLDSLRLGKASRSRVPYTQPWCSQNEVVTNKLVFTAVFTLPPSRYSDPYGYYISWARCCRNYTIQNIYSNDPDRGVGEAAGQTFYLEFPAVMMNNQQFINSSPSNFPALADYACPTKPYYANFAGIDDDGDSLAYSLVTPLNTRVAVASPPPSPAPYKTVRYITGFDSLKAVNGTPAIPQYPDLTISRDGFLRVTPNPQRQGLYVFSVKIDEFRNKKKIGEVRRDFQILVTDCRVSVAPVIVGRKKSEASFVANKLKVQFNNTVADGDRCIVVRITDDDSKRQLDSLRENITLNVIPYNFKSKNLNSILPTPSKGIIQNGGSIEFTICLPACPYIDGGPYEFGVIAFDNACPLPLSDTLRVEVDQQAPHNERAKFTPPDKVNAILVEGDQATWQFEATDAEKDELTLFPLVKGFSIEQSGMKIDVTENNDGVLKGSLHWDAFCDIYDFTKRTDFLLKLLVDDLDQCNLNAPDTLTYNLQVILPPDNKPIVDTDLTPDPEEIEIAGIEKRVLDSWTLNVTGKDLLDNDRVTVQMKGDGFSPSQYGMSMAKASAVGSVSSVFKWDLACSYFNLAQKDEFNIGFIAIDSSNKCRIRQVDSLVVKVKVLKPLNASPTLTITNLNNDVFYENGNAAMKAGQTINLQMDVSDADVPKDNLIIELVDADGDNKPLEWTFDGKTGQSVLTSAFSWTPLCSVFDDGVFEHEYHFDFRFADDHCLTAVADTVRVNVVVKDVESDGFEMEPANVFTPNGDGINDFYSMERRNGNLELINILPPDNCRGVFKNVRIYNRWGRTVFTSSDRNFRWYGLSESAGVYFYHITYSNRDFKGTVSLRD